MRKKTVNHLADTIFWYLLYFLPVICFILVYYRTGNNVGMSQFLNDNGFGLAVNNIVFDTISSIFGADCIMPLFANDGILIILSWFVCVYIAHILVDFCLFIPRWLHNFLKKVYRNED